MRTYIGPPLDEVVLKAAQSAGKQGIRSWDLLESAQYDRRALMRSLRGLRKRGLIEFEKFRWYTAGQQPESRATFLGELNARASEGMGYNEAINRLGELQGEDSGELSPKAWFTSLLASGMITRIRDRVYHPDWVVPRDSKS